MLLAALCAAIVAVIVAAIVVVVVFGWGGVQPLPSRLGLCALGAGLVWGGVDRFLQRPVGLGDLLMLAGLALFLIASFGRAMLTHLDRLDGHSDSRFDPARCS